MRECIAHERALELCFESQRCVDIMRWGWLEDEDQLDTLKLHDPNFNNFVPGREFLAIPPAILESNENLEQDPGWIK